jgi:microsomal dipeptidase-like Zn-dependent dipeptidase
MNYYGIMVDISHPSKEAIRQTIAHSKAPLSHHTLEQEPFQTTPETLTTNSFSGLKKVVV